MGYGSAGYFQMGFGPSIEMNKFGDIGKNPFVDFPPNHIFNGS